MTLLTEMTPGMWVVIIQLRNQVELVRINYPLWGGQLRYFRKAFRMRRFHEVVERVEQILGFGIFSTMQEIESMESAILNCDRTQLIVQCCAILHFCERVNYRDERFSNHEREHSWLFASIRSLEEIAYLRSRLHFVMAASYVWAAMNHSLVRAVNECFLDVWNPPTWQGLLLILKESGPFYSDRFLEHLAEILPNQRTEIPKEAATLFLSYTADAILYLRATFGNRVDADEKKLIVKLLELGASPMISREHHCVFFGRLENHVRTVRSPWWTAWEHLTSSSMKRFPTALNRLLSDSWDPEFSRQLEQYTCCSLDAADTHKKNYRSGRVPKLQCLAAQNLREYDLEALPPTLKFIAAKHQPFSFIQYFRRN